MNAQTGSTLDTVPRAKPTMRNRNFRCDDVTWQAAQDKADDLKVNLSDVLRESLRRFVRDDGWPSDAPAPTHQEDKS